MGPSRAGECRVFSGGSELVHQGRERRKIRKGMEGKGEKLLPGARRQPCGMLSPVRGCRPGEEEIRHMHPERQRGKGGMDLYGGDVTKPGCNFRQKGEQTRRESHGKVVCGNGEEAEEQGQ